MKFRLTADWNGEHDEVSFHAKDSLEAVTTGISITLDNAFHDGGHPLQPVWGNGLIRLVHDATGQVLHTMPEKDVS